MPTPPLLEKLGMQCRTIVGRPKYGNYGIFLYYYLSKYQIVREILSIEVNEVDDDDDVKTLPPYTNSVNMLSKCFTFFILNFLKSCCQKSVF